MKRSIDETAERFDEMSAEYDQARSESAVAAADRVVERALDGIAGDETVLDIGTGTGILALAIAPHVEAVYALDISEQMRATAREKADERGIENVTVGEGTFRDPAASLDLPAVDIVVSNFAMHHLNDEEKADAVATIRALLGPGGRFVLGDVIVFEEADVSVEHYDPAVDDPATVDRLVAIFEREGFAGETEQVGPMAGVVVGRVTSEPQTE
jgi:cyclopropane fatty-acyl-phospholipid synthase-like methyltransferase